LILKHCPLLPEAEFDEAVSALKPLGKPTSIQYLCHLIKLKEIKILWKVTYSDTPEELLWDLIMIPDGSNVKLVGLGFDK